MPDKKTDPGERAAKRAEAEIEEKIKGVYGTAAKELKEKLGSLEKAYADRLAKKQKELAEGKITQDELKAWVKTQLLRQKQVKDQIDQCTGVLLHANEKALGIVNQEQLGVFAENANFQEYQINRDTGLNLMFSVYDEHSVERLIQDNPDMLPPKMVNGKKDKAWNQTRITSAVTQAIIQGESIPKLAKRIAAESAGGNAAAMMRYARTAMTAAQNAGRVEMLHRAQGLGVKCRKRWMATLDSRTRDSHQEMDGEVVGVDDEFSNGLLYPGDPNGAPGEVYNCRCTMTYEYDGIDNALQERMAYNEWDDVHYTTEKDKLGREYQKKHVIHHRTGEMIEYQTYSEWKKRNAPVPEAAQKTTITKEQYDEMKKNRDALLEKEIAQANEWYDKQTDELMDRYGGSFVNQRISVKQDISLTEAEKEKRLDAIEEKRLSYNEERNKLKEERDKKIKAAHDKHDYTFEPQYEYRSIEGKASPEKNAKEVNPNWSYDSFEYTHNCQRCGVAFELRERGFDVEACGAPSGGYESEIRWLFSEAETVEISGRGHQNTIDVRNQMTEWGEGARAIISIQRDGMSGHIFNAEYKDGKFYLIDSQAGACWTDEQKGEEVDGGCLEGEWTNHVTLYRVDNVRMRMPREGWIKAR